MDLSRQEYPNLLTSLQPNEAVNVLNDRIKLITKINSDIADWLQERRRIEDLYVQGLRKLARRPQQDGAAALGIFQMPWQRITSSMENLAQSHETLAQKIEMDVETPLRQFATRNREMQNITTVQGNFVAIAKDVDNAQRKAEKLRGSKADAGRVASASSGIEDATLQWESQAPSVFELLQSVDESRVNHLRDVLTQFQTHEVDQVERNRLTAENCLNALLNIETADEIRTFAARVGGSVRGVPRRQSSTAAGAGSSAPLPPPPRIADDRASQRSGISGGPPRLAPVQEKESKSKFGGIKRLGTVMGRRKSMAPPPPPGQAPEKSKRSRASFAPFRRGDSSNSFQEVGSPPTVGRDLTPVTSQNETSRYTSVESPPPMRRPPTNQSSAPTDPDAIEPFPMPNATGPTTNGFLNPEAQRSPPLPQQPASPSSQPLTDFKPLDRISQDEVGASNPRTPTGPPLSLEAIRASTPNSNTNAENEDALRSLTIRDQPIQEDESAAKQAMDDMANQLRIQAQHSGLSRAQGSVRGRRDVRNTVYVPSPEPSSDPTNVMSHATAAGIAGAAGLASPIKTVPTPVSIPEDRATSDTTSIHSSLTLASAGPVHPELHHPGLNASIIETVSTWFQEGAVTKSFVVGELALAYNPGDATGSRGFPSTTPTNEQIRLENFHELEKVAANPSFVTATTSEKGKERAGGPGDKAGEYSVSLSSINRPTPTVGFKYQVHLDEANLSIHSPILFTPAWQIQDNQASVIIVYALNPGFRSLAHTTSLVLRNVVLTVALDPAAGRATNAMMAPTAGGSFKRKQNLVTWKFPELVIDAEQKKFLARFVTNGTARAGHVEAKWELSGEGGSGLSVSVVRSEGGKEADPFADDDGGSAASPTKGWEGVPCVRKLASGRYNAN